MIRCLLCTLLIISSLESSQGFSRSLMRRAGGLLSRLNSDISGRRRRRRSQGSCILLRSPTAQIVDRMMGEEERDLVNSPQLELSLYNHNLVGMTRPYSDSPVQAEQESKQKGASKWWPGLAVNPDPSWRVLVFRRTAGRGKSCYQQCQSAALRWEFQSDSMGMVAGSAYDPTHSDNMDPTGRKLHQRWLVTYSQKALLLPRWKVHFVNPVRVVYDVVDQRNPDGIFTSTAYATGRGHWLRGEERVSVVYRQESDEVDVEIISVSKPGRSLIGYLVWPFIGRMQRRFFEDEMAHLLEHVSS